MLDTHCLAETPLLLMTTFLRYQIILINTALQFHWPLSNSEASPRIWTCVTRPSFSHMRGGSGHETNRRLYTVYIPFRVFTATIWDGSSSHPRRWARYTTPNSPAVQYNICFETRCTHRPNHTSTIITNASGYELDNLVSLYLMTDSLMPSRKPMEYLSGDFQ